MISFLGKAELAQMDEPNIELKCQSVHQYMMFLPLSASKTLEVKNDHANVITQDICNKFIEVDFWFHSQIVCCNL